ncbi:MAG: hypothetical protein MZV70_17580 [Desulfobacterales bacterium]|nr:hypothetical protein [Desulfobacterales bacterium]
MTRIGSTRYVDFDTARDVYRTRPDKCHVSHVVLDSGWEGETGGSALTMKWTKSFITSRTSSWDLPFPIHFNGEEKSVSAPITSFAWTMVTAKMTC